MPDRFPPTAAATREAIARRELTAEGAVQQAIDRIRDVDGALHAFLHVDEAGALARARALDRQTSACRAAARRARSPSRTTSARAACRRRPGSRILEGYAPPYDATVDRAARTCRRGRRRQDGLRRVRDGIVDRALRLRRVAQSLGPGPDAGRLQRRIGRRRRGGPDADRARIRHRRIGTPASGALRRRRAEARPTAASRAMG